MAKRLTLVRHAKSSWNDPSAADIDRALNNRGVRDAPMMGRRLLERGARPSLILTSTAKRARKTARLVAKQLGYPVEFIQGEAELYLASPDTIVDVVAQQDDGFNDLMLFGHNPGITDLSNRLTGAGIDNVPTCGIVAIDATVDTWAELNPDTCELAFFDYPKNTTAI